MYVQTGIYCYYWGSRLKKKKKKWKNKRIEKHSDMAYKRKQGRATLPCPSLLGQVSGNMHNELRLKDKKVTLHFLPG